MQPMDDLPRFGGGSSMRRWGPIAAIIVVLAIIIGVVLVGSGDDDDNEYIQIPTRSEARLELRGWDCTEQGASHWVCTR